MSADNPEKAINALLPPVIPIAGTGEVVRPITLAAFAVLERIGSPLLKASTDYDTLSLLPSLYTLCRGAEAAIGEKNLLAASVAWADTLPPGAMLDIREAALAQIAAFVDTLPQGKKESGISDITAG